MPLKKWHIVTQFALVISVVLQLFLRGAAYLDAQSTKPAPPIFFAGHPQPQADAPSNPQASSAPRPAAKKVDSSRPREIDGGDEKVVMNRPQLEAWEGVELRAYAAISVKQKVPLTNQR